QNAEIMKLICDAPVGVTVDELDRRPPDVDEVRHLFDFLEFHSLGERRTEALGEDLGVGRPPAEVLEADVTSIASPGDAAALLVRLRESAAGGPPPPAPAPPGGGGGGAAP